jgi:hypothetical protein
MIQLQLKLQLNSMLFAKTLVRKDVASSAPPPPASNVVKDAPIEAPETGAIVDGPAAKTEAEFSSKAQVMTLMTTDVDRVGQFSWHAFLFISACRFIHFAHGQC